MTKKIRIGFIGFGEAAQSISEGLRDSGYTGIDVYHYKGLQVPENLLKKGNELGVQFMESPKKLAEACQIILNVTKAAVAKETALEILPFLTNHHLYTDLNSVNPMLMEEIAGIFQQQGFPFIDGALMAPLPLTKHQVPIIAAGDGANDLAELLNSIGMNVEVIKGNSGSASSVKMVRSLFMKGLATLLIETFVAAKASGGGYEKIMDSMRKTMTTSFDTLLNRFLTGTIQHAERRSVEIENALSFVTQKGINPVMTNATLQLLQMISEQSQHIENSVAPTGFEEIYTFYKKVFTVEDLS